MIRRIILPATLLVLASAMGCSTTTSATDGGVTGDDGSTGGDTGSGSSSGSSSGGGDDGSTTADGSGSSSGGSSGSSSGGSDASTGGDAGTCTAATTVATPPAYTAVVQQSACSHADVTAFIAACVNGSQQQCTTWFQTAANAACGACIQPQNDAGAPPVTGATIYDNQGGAYLNQPGCVAVTDGNTTCAAPLEQLELCEFDACNSAACSDPSTTQMAYDACRTAADTGACSAEHTAAAPCQADVADGGALAGVCGTTDGVIYAICGNGS